jgi:catechol 2,3-dioxygenase-like lactoylglutathione lyase family enzyme
MTLPLDHLTILSSDESASRAWYGLVLPMLGFVQTKSHIWRNENGLHLQFGSAKPATRAYERYGAGLNHLGFAAPSVAFVEDVAARMANAGHEARLQRFADGTVALFLPDPDGLRIEVSFYPDGTPPVD